jgi:hypothetical protein
VVQLADSTTSPTSGDLASFDASGNIKDSGVLASAVVQSLTTTGTSGAATLASGVLNVPQYSGGGSGTTIWTGAANPNGSTSANVAPTTMTGNSAPSPYVASASSQFFSQSPYLAFAGNPANAWVSSTVPATLTIDLGAANAALLQGYGILNINPDQAGREPKAWVFQGSNNNSTWTTLDTQTGQTGWSGGQLRNFTVSAVTSFRYFQVVISLNNGDTGPLVLISQLYLYSLSASPFTSGSAGDFYFRTDGSKQVYGPRPSGGTPTWPFFGSLN